MRDGLMNVRRAIFEGSLAVICGAMLTAACGRDESLERRAPPEAIPESVFIAGGTVVEGVTSSPVHVKQEVSAYRIALMPITVARYRQCVSASVCNAPSWTTGFCDAKRAAATVVDGPTYGEGADRADLPATCVTPAQAAAYCRWVGGRLPTSAEWLLAARGPAIQRFAWGNRASTCDEMFRTSFVPAPHACCGRDCSTAAIADVGTHPGGASAAGMLDVLLTQSELIGASAESLWASCRLPSSGCFVSSFSPGAIDSVRPLWIADDAAPIAAFRCAWDDAP